MGMLNRIATETNLGATGLGGGLGVEVVKNIADDDTPSIDIMLIDWIFWTDSAHLNTGGLIAFVGLAVMLHGAYRGRKQRIKREKNSAL